MRRRPAVEQAGGDQRRESALESDEAGNFRSGGGCGPEVDRAAEGQRPEIAVESVRGKGTLAVVDSGQSIALVEEHPPEFVVVALPSGPRMQAEVA